MFPYKTAGVLEHQILIWPNYSRGHQVYNTDQKQGKILKSNVAWAMSFFAQKYMVF